MATSLLTGAAFGAAMIAAGFQNPAIVVAQFKHENWHMFQAFLAATATSTAVVAIAERLNYVNLKPRSSSPIGLFTTYDGNIIGGALLGAGMALSGSCPGTLYAQLAAGVHTGFHALDGALLGGLLWTGLLSKLVKRNREKTDSRPVTITADEPLGLSKGATLVIFEAAVISALAVITLNNPKYPGVKVLGTTGGLLIGFSQLLSLISRKSLIGISGSYEEFGNFFWWLVKGAEPNARPQSYQSLIFAVGASAGAWGLLQALPSLRGPPAFEVPPYLAMTGGAVMAIGARMAGGCTSGHGLSGMSLLSVSSMITMASMFVAGSIVAPLVF